MQADSLRVIRLAGSPLDRGRVHGEELRAEIRRVCDVHRESLGLLYGVSPRTYLEEFFRYQDFLGAIAREAPALLEEVRGIAEGAGLPFESILLLQLIDEEWVFGRTVWPKRESLRSKCTSFGLLDAPRGRAYAGQNMDIPAFHEGAQVILHVCGAQHDFEMLLFSSAGNLGLTGVNNAAVAVCCNTLIELPASNRGLPVAFVLRRLLETASFAEARAVLRSVPHASGQNFLLASRQAIGSFECSANGVYEVADPGIPDAVCHTNHVLSREWTGERPGPERLQNSRARLASIRARLALVGRPPAVESFRQALAAADDPAHPVSRKLKSSCPTDAMSYTAGSLIYELGETTRMHVAPGPPCETEYRVLELAGHT